MPHLSCDKVEMIPSALEFTVPSPPRSDLTFPYVLTQWPVPGGVCVRQTLQFDSGYCFLVGSGLNSTCAAALGWVLQEGSGMLNNRSTGRIIACGALPSLRLTSWHSISLSASSNQSVMTLIGTVDAIEVVDYREPEPVKWRQGMANLRSGLHYALFDDLAVV